MLFIKKFTFNAFQENTYIIYNETNQAIIIDPGMYDVHEFKQFDAFIQSSHLNPVLLLNTHTHLDHVFGNAHVKRTYGIPFAFHESDKPVFDASYNVGHLYGLAFEKSPEPDYYIEEGKPIQLGTDIFEVFLTPGHSPGSICLYQAQQAFILVGDVIFNQSVGRTDLPGGNYETLMHSIQSHLLPLPDQVKVYSGHGPETTIGYEKIHNPFLRSH